MQVGFDMTLNIIAFSFLTSIPAVIAYFGVRRNKDQYKRITQGSFVLLLWLLLTILIALFIFRSPLWAFTLVLSTFLTPLVFMTAFGNLSGMAYFAPSLLLVLSWVDLGYQIIVYRIKTLGY